MVSGLETGTPVIVKLADGTIIDGLTVNGNNFVSKTPISGEVFEDNLSTVTVIVDGDETVYHDVKLVQNRQFGSEYMFVLAEKTPEEVERDELLQVVADLAELTLEVLDNGG